MATAQEPFRYREAGSKSARTTIVFLHGLFGSPENWAPIMDALADGYHGLAPQFPIDHRPDRRPQDFRSIHQLTDFVRDFLDDRGVERAVLCGNSLGGQVAIDFCLRYPERAERLVLTGSAGLFERNLAGGELPKVTREFIREKAREIFYDPDPIVTEEMIADVQRMLADRQYVRFLLRVAKATRNYNVREELSKLRLPTLILWGRNDRITPPSVAREFYENLPHARLVFLERCGHSPPIERPQAFSRALRSFLKSPMSSPQRVC